MGFSFRSIFQSSSAPDEAQQVPPSYYPQFPSSSAAFEPVPPHMQQPAPPLNGSPSPFSAGNPLFRTVAGEGIPPSSAAHSPFAVPATSNTSSPLTVGDVLPQLPADVARFGSLSPDQPVAIAPSTLDAALRSGQAALPIFEIYRVCPALFQTPISPQDPRTVPLPAAKLARLIATAQQAAPGAPAFEVLAPPQPSFNPGSASPFGLAEPAGPAPLPFGLGTPLPPRREGAPRPLSEPLQDAPPPAAMAQAPVASPFGLVAPGDLNGASPFSLKPEDPQPAKPSLFAPAAEPAPQVAQAPTPFGITPSSGPSPVTPTPSIFGTPPTSPFGSSPAPALLQPDTKGMAPAPPFAGLFAATTPPATQEVQAPPTPALIQPIQPNSGASLFGPAPATQPESAPPAAVQPSTPPPAFAVPSPNPTLAPAVFAHAPLFPPAPPAPTAGGFGSTFRVSLASLLKGYTAEELGFDPSMVPAFIMTALPSGLMRDQVATGTPTADLGLLVDGITDIGFRNVLSQVKREFQLRLPLAELTSALAAASTPAVAPASPGPANQAAMLRVEPPAQISPMPSAMAPAGDRGSSFFAGSPRQTEPPSEPAIPLFGAAPPAEAEHAPPPPSAFAAEPEPPAPSLAIAPPSVPVLPNIDPFASPPSEAVGTAAKREAEERQPAPALSQASAPSQESIDSGPSSSDEKNEAISSPEPVASPWSSAPAAPRSRPASPFPEPKPVVPALFEEAPATGAAQPSKSPPPSTARRTKAPISSLGLQPLDTESEQILLRALLSTDEDLTPQRVVELTGQLPGIAACVCLKGQTVLSHAGAHKPQAREFQRQAADLAHHLRTLGPLIGIDGAETFTLNAGDRLMTFCFPDSAILGVLHDAEPSLGLRDKITLIAREVSRMLAD